MAILIITVLLLGSLAVVLYPVFYRSAEAPSAKEAGEEVAQQLRRARDRVYEEVCVLQQEYFLHHLTEEEYRNQVQAARIQAAHLLRQQEQALQTVAELEQAIEEEVRRASRGVEGGTAV
jgi:biopolymer transport protein ExbB/TolQ